MEPLQKKSRAVVGPEVQIKILQLPRPVGREPLRPNPTTPGGVIARKVHRRALQESAHKSTPNGMARFALTRHRKKGGQPFLADC